MAIPTTLTMFPPSLKKLNPGENHQKTLHSPSPACHVEFPPEDNSSSREETTIRNEEEDALSLTLVTGLSIKKRKQVCPQKPEISTNEKKAKTTSNEQNVPKFEGEFGSFSVGYYPKKEVAGRILPSPS